jgi:hypothetical protein
MAVCSYTATMAAEYGTPVTFETFAGFDLEPFLMQRFVISTENAFSLDRLIAEVADATDEAGQKRHRMLCKYKLEILDALTEQFLL